MCADPGGTLPVCATEHAAYKCSTQLARPAAAVGSSRSLSRNPSFDLYTEVFMKFVRAVAMVAGLFCGASALAQDAEAVGKAQLEASRWVALADAGQFAASWDQAAKSFQAAIERPKWESAVQAARAPLGAVKSRKLKSAVFTTSLPGAPDGEYVVVQYDTQFENKSAAVETVTPMKDKDGTWRVSGYFIK
jgi:hypothetical protein